MLEEIKNSFNLDEKEAKVYLAALELGRSRVSLIAKKAGLNRITAYEILKRLMSIGLAQSALYGGIQTFVVAAPEVLLEKMESKLNVAKKFLPQLVSISKAGAKRPQVAYFEGAEGIRSVYEDTLNCREKVILNIANPQNLVKTISQDFFDQYVKKRIRRKIHVQVLIPDSPANRKYKQEGKSVLREIKFFDGEKYPIPNEILIYDNKVALLSFSSLVGVITEDKDIAESMKTLWRMIWDQNK